MRIAAASWFAQTMDPLKFDSFPCIGDVKFIFQEIKKDIFVTVNGKTYLNAYPLDRQKR